MSSSGLCSEFTCVIELEISSTDSKTKITVVTHRVVKLENTKQTVGSKGSGMAIAYRKKKALKEAFNKIGQ